jgi:carbonic anhydrase
MKSIIEKEITDAGTIFPENARMTPKEALLRLKEGNFRFLNNMRIERDLLHLVDKTKDGQTPFAAILSCMDSRVSTDIVFDQGVGDIFGIRIAGNIVTDDILGSLEYAAAVAGSKLIVVLGHTNCGAVKGACDGVKLGHITSLLEKIKPAIEQEKTHTANRNSENEPYVTEVTKLNVLHSVDEILRRSDIIRDLKENGTIEIIPALYNVATGIVSFKL